MNFQFFIVLIHAIIYHNLIAPAFGGQRVAGASLLEQWLLYHQAVLFRLEVSCSKSSFFKHILQAYKLERSILSSNLGIWIRNIDRNSKPALLHTNCVAGHRGGSLCIVRLGWICKSYTRAISDKGSRKGTQTQVLVHQYVPKINSTYCAL